MKGQKAVLKKSDQLTFTIRANRDAMGVIHYSMDIQKDKITDYELSVIVGKALNTFVSNARLDIDQINDNIKR